MTVCVTFGAPCFGPKYRHICARSEYVTFCTISAIAVREMTVCVTFGAPHFRFPVAIWRRPIVDHIGGVSHGSGFPQLRSEFVLGRHRVACFFVARHCPCKCTMIVFEIAWRAKLALAKRYAHVAVGNAWWRLLFHVLFFRAEGFIANGVVCHGHVVDSKFAAYRGNVGAARRGCRFADRVRRSYLCCGLFPSWLPVLLQLPACTRVEPHLASGLRWVMGGWDVPSLGDTPRCRGVLVLFKSYNK